MDMHDNCGERPLLGTVLMAQGVVERDEINEALMDQVENGKRLGEILVDRGAICRPELERAIAGQSGLYLDEEAGYGSGLRAAIERQHRLRRDFGL
jgi:hypothetical protein